MKKRAVFAQAVTQYWAVDLPDLPENIPDEVVRVLAGALYKSDPDMLGIVPGRWRAFAETYYRQHEDDGLQLVEESSVDGGELEEIEEVKP